MVTTINTVQEFNTFIASNKVVIVDFYATWCMPCKMLAPVIEELSVAHPEYAVCKVDVDKLSEIAQIYKVYSIPHVQIIKDGNASGNIVGYRDLETLVSDIKNAL